jgi:hypothetical protein
VSRNSLAPRRKAPFLLATRLSTTCRHLNKIVVVARWTPAWKFLASLSHLVAIPLNYLKFVEEALRSVQQQEV